MKKWTNFQCRTTDGIHPEWAKFSAGSLGGAAGLFVEMLNKKIMEYPSEREVVSRHDGDPSTEKTFVVSMRVVPEYTVKEK